MKGEAMIERLRELEKAATPAPWKADSAGVWWPETGGEICAVDLYAEKSGHMPREDAALIAEARNALPLLLDAAAALAEIVTEFDKMKKGPGGYLWNAIDKARAALASLEEAKP